MKYIMKPKTLRAGLLVFIVVLLCVVVALVWLRREQPKTTQLVGEAQVLRDRADAIEAKTPAESAPLNDKLAYYDQLVQAKRISDDHQGAVTAFEKRLKLTDKDLDYLDYLHIALSYQTIDRKPEALSALNQAEKLLPPDSPDEGFFRAEVLEDITRIRSELQ